jgi:Mg/Co/Ni transporter MgtE
VVDNYNILKSDVLEDNQRLSGVIIDEDIIPERFTPFAVQ